MAEFEQVLGREMAALSVIDDDARQASMMSVDEYTGHPLDMIGPPHRMSVRCG
jgi:hypothetical protein